MPEGRGHRYLASSVRNWIISIATNKIYLKKKKLSLSIQITYGHDKAQKYKQLNTF